MATSKTKRALSAARAILVHRLVSRAMCGADPMTPALDCLSRARITRANYKAGVRNAKEEAPAAARHESQHGPGSAYDAGYAISLPSPPVRSIARRIQEALDLGLPDDLATLCQDWLTMWKN